MESFDVIYLEDEEDDDSSELASIAPDPIVVKGSGSVMVFGLTNHFSCKFPKGLASRVAPEEFEETIAHVNSVLRKRVPLNAKWLLCGCFCCCCTLGVSMWPVLCLNKKTKQSVKKILEWENVRLYHRLGLHWRLSKEHGDPASTLEYVLSIEFLPKMPIYRPD